MDFQAPQNSSANLAGLGILGLQVHPTLKVPTRCGRNKREEKYCLNRFVYGTGSPQAVQERALYFPPELLAFHFQGVKCKTVKISFLPLWQQRVVVVFFRFVPHLLDVPRTPFSKKICLRACVFLQSPFMECSSGKLPLVPAILELDVSHVNWDLLPNHPRFIQREKVHTSI